MFCNVHIVDLSSEEIEAMVDYCEEYKLELVSFSNTDICDAGKWDTVASFQFNNEEDALMFKLKFKCE